MSLSNQKYRPAQSLFAKKALILVEDLQDFLAKQLDGLRSPSLPSAFHPVHWLRNEGESGGGRRLASDDRELFNQASINVSQVQYEADPSKALASATALSTIIHMANPFAPSLHLHISWTEKKSGGGYWRLMADLNPGIPTLIDRMKFEAALRRATGAYYAEGVDQGNRYFYIPSLDRHRGVAHFYLEEHNSGDFNKDLKFAEDFGRTMILEYRSILDAVAIRGQIPSEHEYQKQLMYHSLYFFQVLTLDRGTTSGLLVHNENDLGVLGSLPSRVNLDLLSTWTGRLPELQQKLFTAILACFPDAGGIGVVNEDVKQRIAHSMRAFYERFPDALDLLASGNGIPLTHANHRDV